MARRPISLLPFLRSIGGLRDDRGELANLGLRSVRQSRTNRRWLVHSGGLALDRARELAAEAGYLWRFGSPSEAIAESTPADLIDLIREEHFGNLVWSEFDFPDLRDRDARESGLAADGAMLREFDDEIDESGISDSRLIESARAILFETGTDAADAIERAIVAWGEDSDLPDLIPDEPVTTRAAVNIAGVTVSRISDLRSWAMACAESILALPLPAFTGMSDCPF